MRLRNLLLIAPLIACQRGGEAEPAAPPTADARPPESGAETAMEESAEETEERTEDKTGGHGEAPSDDQEQVGDEDELAGDSEALGEPRPGIHNLSEIKRSLGKEITIVGQAADAKISAAVLVEGSPIYCLAQSSWPDGVAGEQVEVQGVVRRTDRYRAEKDKSGAISQGTAGGDLVIEPCHYHLLTVD